MCQRRKYLGLKPEPLKQRLQGVQMSWDRLGLGRLKERKPAVDWACLIPSHLTLRPAASLSLLGNSASSNPHTAAVMVMLHCGQTPHIRDWEQVKCRMTPASPLVNTAQHLMAERVTSSASASGNDYHPQGAFPNSQLSQAVVCFLPFPMALCLSPIASQCHP